MISPSRQRVKIKKIPIAFYTFLSSLYNFLLKFTLLMILLGEVLNSEENPPVTLLIWFSLTAVVLV